MAFLTASLLCCASGVNHDNVVKDGDLLLGGHVCG